MNIAKHHLYLLSLLLLILSACKDPIPVIQEVDLSAYRIDPSMGLDESQMDSMISAIDGVLESKTLNHRLPEIELGRLDGSKEKIYSLLKDKKQLLLFGAEFCAPCHISYFENFPKIIDSLERRKVDYSFIPIIFESDADAVQPEAMMKFAKEVKAVFGQVYIIEESEAKRINLYGYPSNYFINEAGTVLRIGKGASVDLIQIKIDQLADFFQ